MDFASYLQVPTKNNVFSGLVVRVHCLYLLIYLLTPLRFPVVAYEPSGNSRKINTSIRTSTLSQYCTSKKKTYAACCHIPAGDQGYYLDLKWHYYNFARVGI